MKRFLAAAAIAIFAAAPSFAEDAVSPERLALAKQVMELSGAAKAYDNAEKNIDLMMGQMLQGVPNLDPAFVADVKKMTIDEFTASKPELIDASLKIYARHFSEDDLRALVAFYKSDAGKHFAAELPAVSQECMQLSIPMMKRLMAKVQKSVADKIAAEHAAQSPDKQDKKDK